MIFLCNLVILQGCIMKIGMIFSVFDKIYSDSVIIFLYLISNRIKGTAIISVTVIMTLVVAVVSVLSNNNIAKYCYLALNALQVT